MPKDRPGHSVSVLINLYNYGQFVGEAIDSVLAQSIQADEIIVVDDGSEDDSCAQVEQRATAEPRVRLIRKSNEGQLSCFQRGFEASTGEFVFFLDADDVWEPDHIGNFLAVFEAHPDVDLVYSGFRCFGQSTRQHRAYPTDTHHGKNVISTLFNRSYYGAITSANAIRRPALKPLFPAPQQMLELFRTNADAWIVYGVSIYGGVSFYVDSDTVRYRIHEKNHYFKKAENGVDRYGDVLKQLRLIEHLRRRAEIPLTVRYEFYREFQTNPQPGKKAYRKALSTLNKLDLPFSFRLRTRIRIWQHYRKNGVR